MSGVNEFSTECVRFARGFFERFGDDQVSAKAYKWLRRNIDHDNPLPYLRAITMRPECDVWFYDFFTLSVGCLCVNYPLSLASLSNVIGRDDEWIIHPDYVRWNGEVLFDGRD